MKKFSSITRVNSRRISQTRTRVRIAIFTLLAVVVLLLVPSVVRGLVAIAVAPVNATKTWLADSGKSFPQYFRDRSALVTKINDLKSQLAAQGGDKYTVTLLSAENERLRGLLGESGSTKRILAGVIGRPNALPYDTLLLDVGSADGVTENAPVFVGKYSVIGLVRSVTKHTALAELITTPGFVSTVYVLGPNVYTNAVGQGGGQLRVGVPQGLPLKVGDVVVLPTVKTVLFGAISTIENSPEQPEQYGYVSPKIPLASLRYVAIGRTPLATTTFAAAEKMVNSTTTKLFTIPLSAEVVSASGTSAIGTTTIPTRATTSTTITHHHG